MAESNWQATAVREAWEPTAVEKQKNGKKTAKVSVPVEIEVPVPPLEELMATLLESNRMLVGQIEALVQSQQTAMDAMQTALDKQLKAAERNMDARIAAAVKSIETTLAAPRTVTLQRDKDGVAVSATSTVKR